MIFLIIFFFKGCKANSPTKGDHEPTEVISGLSNFTNPPEVGAMESINNVFNNDLVDSSLEENNPHHSPKIIITYFGKSKVNRTNFSPFTPFHKLFLFFLLNAHKNEMEREYDEREPKIVPRSSVFDHSFITEGKNKIIDLTKNLTEKVKSIVPRENLPNSNISNQTFNVEKPKNVSNFTSQLVNPINVNLNNNNDSDKMNIANKTEEVKTIPLFTEEDLQKALEELNKNKKWAETKSENETETKSENEPNNTKIAINSTLVNVDQLDTTSPNVKDINVSRSLIPISTQNNSMKQINFEIETELELKHYVSKFHDTKINSSFPQANGTQTKNDTKILNIKIRDVPLSVNSSLIAVLPNYLRTKNSRKEQLLPNTEIDEILRKRLRRSHAEKASMHSPLTLVLPDFEKTVKREQLLVNTEKSPSSSHIENEPANSLLTEQEILGDPKMIVVRKNRPRRTEIAKESINSTLITLPNVKIVNVLENKPRRSGTEKALDHTNSTININTKYEMQLKNPQEDIFNISKTNSLILALANDTKSTNVTVALTEEKVLTNATDLDSIINPILSEFAKQNKVYPNPKSAKNDAVSTQLKKLPVIFVTLPTVLCKLLITFVY